MLIPRLALAVGAFLALLASQLPEFAQQYRQRLGGAIDELTREVVQFGSEAQSEHLTPNAAITRLQGNGDRLAQQRGADMHQEMSRLERLERQRDNFVEAGPLKRLVVLVEDFDPYIARRAYSSFEPAVPTTSEGLITAVAGLVLGTGLVHGLAWPFRLRRRLRTETEVESAGIDSEESARQNRTLRRRMARYTLPPARSASETEDT